MLLAIGLQAGAWPAWLPVGFMPVQRVTMTLKGRVGPFTGACCQGHIRLNSGQLLLICQVAEAQEEEFMRDTAVLNAMAVSANGNSL